MIRKIFSYIFLCSLVISNVCFSGNDLHYALVLTDEKNLQNIDLSGFDCSGLNFSGRNLSGANLSGGKFKGCDFSNTILDGANLSGSDFGFLIKLPIMMSGPIKFGEDGSFQVTKFNGSHMHKTICKKTNFLNASMVEVDMLGGNYQRANFTNVALVFSTLRRVDFRGATFAGTLMNGSKFLKCNFTLSKLMSVKMLLATIRGVIFKDVKVSCLDISGTRCDESFDCLENAEICCNEIVKPSKIFYDKQCGICKNNYKSGDRVAVLSCGHIFCVKCIPLWLYRYADERCPHCFKSPVSVVHVGSVKKM